MSRNAGNPEPEEPAAEAARLTGEYTATAMTTARRERRTRLLARRHHEEDTTRSGDSCAAQ